MNADLVNDVRPGSAATESSHTATAGRLRTFCRIRPQRTMANPCSPFCLSGIKNPDVYKDKFTLFLSIFFPLEFFTSFFFRARRSLWHFISPSAFKLDLHSLTMHFTLFSVIFSLFALTTLIHSAPTASLDSTTLLNNALEAQKLNAQFQADNTATGSCTSKCL